MHASLTALTQEIKLQGRAFQELNLTLSSQAEKNAAEGHAVPLYGIISNGQGWQFCRRDLDGSVVVTSLYALTDLPHLLGILRSIFTAIEANLVSKSDT